MDASPFKLGRLLSGILHFKLKARYLGMRQECDLFPGDKQYHFQKANCMSLNSRYSRVASEQSKSSGTLSARVAVLLSKKL
jgi:hypothetical protein